MEIKLFSLTLILLVAGQLVTGKCRGRWNIHACVGGNGKRSGNTEMTPDVNEEVKNLNSRYRLLRIVQSEIDRLRAEEALSRKRFAGAFNTDSRQQRYLPDVYNDRATRGGAYDEAVYNSDVLANDFNDFPQYFDAPPTNSNPTAWRAVVSALSSALRSRQRSEMTKER